MQGKKEGLKKPGKNQDSSAPKKRNNDAESLMRHNIQVASTGLDGYIALDAEFLNKGTIEDWVHAAAVALAASGREVDLVSYLSAPQAPPGVKGGKVKKAPALTVHFTTEELLRAALGPISIMGLETEIVRYRGGKGCIFGVALGNWGTEPEKIINAFKEQALVEIDGWGWHRIAGAKVNLVLKSVLPAGRNLSTVKIDGWHLKCTRAEEQKCFCCGLAHDCFAAGTLCGNFTHG